MRSPTAFVSIAVLAACGAKPAADSVPLTPELVAADGSFRLTGVSGRSRRLVVRAVGFAARVVDLELPRDVLAPGPLVVTLEQGAAIEVVVDRSVAREGGFVQLRRDGRFLANAEMTEAGAATFANRSAGTYTVQVVGDPRPAKVVVVEPGVPRVPVRLP